MTPAAARALWLVSGLLVARALAPAEPRGELAPSSAPPSGSARLLYGERIDVNREPAAVLELIPGIGQQRAAAIVARRPHCDLADLDRVPGIGPVLLAALARSVSFADSREHCGLGFTADFY